MSTPHAAGEQLQIAGPPVEGTASILTPAAQAFVARLARMFESRRRELLQARRVRQQRIHSGELPDFLPQTEEIRRTEWRVAPIPADLQDRRVEITGPVDRKMIINALNSGANVFMADFEDSNSPMWQNNIEGQVSLRDAVRRTITYTSPEGKEYRLEPNIATLFVRPRGWHLLEKHVMIDGQPVSASLFDFGLFLFHNAAVQIERGTGPYFYLPKLESHFEARLWADVFRFSEDALGIPRGSIRATVLIETILAAFEMHEILWELRDYSAGLNCGRWDYIFSFIKKFNRRADCVLPDRGSVTMTSHFLRSYSQLVIQTCHRRGAFAMGGMAAQIPIKGDAAANEQALARVRADKEREAGDGHDGTWVAHPGLVGLAREIFDRLMPRPNNLQRLREDVRVSATDLLAVPEGEITHGGLANNIDVGIRYLAAWLGGNGCVPIHHLMEDAATAEISRAQLWQWRHHGRQLSDGRTVTLDLVRAEIAAQLRRIRAEAGETGFAAGHFERAAAILDLLTASPEFEPFLTLVAYRDIE
jgi:malate synthase